MEKGDFFTLAFLSSSSAFSTILVVVTTIANADDARIVVATSANSVVPSFPFAKQNVNFVVDAASPTNTTAIVGEDIAAHPVGAVVGIEADIVESTSATVNSRIFVGEPTNTVFSSEHSVAFIVGAAFPANTKAVTDDDSVGRSVDYVRGIKVVFREDEEVVVGN